MCTHACVIIILDEIKIALRGHMKDKNEMKLLGGGQCRYVLQLRRDWERREKGGGPAPGVWRSGTANVGFRALFWAR